MRVAAELRDDGVYVAAGVELIEPESRWTSPNVPGHVFVTPSKTARVGDKLGWQAEQRLRAATRSDEYGPAGVRRTQMLKRCACSAVFVGDPGARHCPACKRAADLAATRAAVRRMRLAGPTRRSPHATPAASQSASRRTRCSTTAAAPRAPPSFPAARPHSRQPRARKPGTSR
jgi:hypothetical protein